MKFLAQGSDINTIFGTPVVPPGPKAIYEGSVTDNFARLFGFAVNFAFVLGGIFVLIYLMWGAFDIINSHGDKENMAKARIKITNAIVGLLVLIAVLVIWVTLTQIVGLTTFSGGNIQFKLPGFGN